MAVYGGFLDCVLVGMVRYWYGLMVEFVLVEVVVVVVVVVEVGMLAVGYMMAYKDWLVERSMGVEGLEGDGM